MRCEECRPLVEEYFDGELERRQSERVSAHLAACEGCAAALDALTSEQEMYLRYDRGLEVSPALWQNVRAGLARLEETERAAKPLPPLVGLRERLGNVFKAFAPRAAFAPALALVVLAAFVGALWLARTRDSGPAPEVARRDEPAPRVEVRNPPAVDRGKVDEGKQVETGVAAVSENRDAEVAANVSVVNPKPDAPGRVTPRRAALTPPPAPEYLSAAEAERLLDGAAPAPVPDSTDVVIATVTTRQPSPEEKEMARHLEQAQALLLSFQNEARAEGGDAVQMAYERRLSRKLLAENETYRIEAEASGDKATRQVLDTLEPFLLDIANLRDNASRDEVRSIRERMQKKEIIAALHVY